MIHWFRLRTELGRWRQAGKRPKLWWRDDDARSPTPQLHKLLVKATRAGVPVCLSVIPQGLSSDLCALVSPYPQVTILQHGRRHLNEGGHPASEFSATADADYIKDQLARGWTALEGFQRRLRVYVPPWNTLTPNVTQALAESGYRVVSAWGSMGEPGRRDTHVDIMRWRPAPHFAGQGRVLSKLRRQLRGRRLEGRWDEPIGILTHHLVQDDASWAFLEALFIYPPLRQICDWPDASVLFDTVVGGGVAPIRPQIVAQAGLA